MSDSEEETYSIIFKSLKHPARRKILRMLSEKPRTFSQLWDSLEISSSHLTYHLESLGELVTKKKDGKYKLSTFGAAAVLTMKGVEDTPDIKSKNWGHLPNVWKCVVALLIVCIVVLATVSVVQKRSLDEISVSQQSLEAQLVQLSAENNRLLSWDVHLDVAKSFLSDVVQIDLTRYTTTLVTNTVAFRDEFGGVAEETLRYTLITNGSELDVDFRFRNQTLSRYRMTLLEGAPIYAKTRPTDFSVYVSELLTRIQTYSGSSYFGEMQKMFDEANEFGDTVTVKGNKKLVLTTNRDNNEVQWFYTNSGIDYQAKGVMLTFEDGVLVELTDGYYLYHVASTQINISEEQAVAIAVDYAEKVSWTAGGQLVNNFTVLPEAVDVKLYPHPRTPLELIPYWYVTLQLDQVYPNNVYGISVGLWADTGEVSGHHLVYVD